MGTITINEKLNGHRRSEENREVMRNLNFLGKRTQLQWFQTSGNFMELVSSRGLDDHCELFGNIWKQDKQETLQALF